MDGDLRELNPIWQFINGMGFLRLGSYFSMDANSRELDTNPHSLSSSVDCDSRELNLIWQSFTSSIWFDSQDLDLT